MSLSNGGRHPAADQRIDPARLSPLARKYYDAIWWHYPPIRDRARLQWEFAARALESGETAEAVAREMEDIYAEDQQGPDDPVTAAAQAFARSLVVQVASARSRRPRQ